MGKFPKRTKQSSDTSSDDDDDDDDDDSDIDDPIVLQVGPSCCWSIITSTIRFSIWKRPKRRKNNDGNKNAKALIYEKTNVSFGCWECVCIYNYC